MRGDASGGQAPPRLAGIELGGTKCVTVLGMGERIVERRSFPTTTPEETLALAVGALEAWHSDAPIEALGIASFGPVRVNPHAADHGTILDTPKANWAGTALLDTVRKHFAGPIGLDTDVNAAALAEYAQGSARGCSTVVYLTIGTGLGGGLLLNGHPARGRLHPEIGHIRLRRVPGDEFAGTCPFHGDCIEGLIAGPALAARFQADPADLADDDAAWNNVVRDLAELLAVLMLAVSPERIVVGGGVANHQPHLLARSRLMVPDLLAGYVGSLSCDDMAQIVCPPALGDDAGPIGALLLAARALQHSEAGPARR